ncbi:MAG: S1C family serine protease, partial [Chloroflexota bacterium]
MASVHRLFTWVLVLIIVAPVFAGCTASGAVPAQAEDPQAQAPFADAPLSFRETVDTIMPSVVYILVEQTFEDDDVAYGSGSGVIMRSDGYVLTNRHVVEGADRIEVTLQDRTVLEATEFWLDDALDLAVVKFEASGLPEAEFADPRQLKVGDWVVAVGHPFGVSPETAGATVTAGVVSNTGLAFYIGEFAYYDVIQTDAAINPGNSGGPLVNLAGEVVGINSAGLPGAQNVGFAIGARPAEKVLNDLIEYGDVQRPYFGANLGEITPEVACRECLEERIGVRIFNVVEGGPAWRAGLRDNDVITSVDGEEVFSVSQFVIILWSRSAGDRL